jgi:uncharacterized circularly permuted ATP-grasp superfamily protein
VSAPYDEAYDERGEPRPHYAELLAAFDDPAALAAEVMARLRGHRVTFDAAPGGIFALDPVPRLLTGDEWLHLERGITQRLEALELFLRDVYGDEDTPVPRPVVESSPHFEPAMRGAPVRRWISVAGMDVVRAPDGGFMVLEDQIRMPAGAAYAVAARDTLRETLPVEPPQADQSPFFGELALALHAAAPEGTAEPQVVTLCEGPGAAGWWEHARLARELCAPTVRLADLELRGGRVVAWIDGRPKAIDVVYHRTDEDRFGGTAVGDLLLEPCRAGTVACVNPPGCGVADDKLVHAYVDDLVRFYSGEEPLLPSVPSRSLAEDAGLEHPELLVVKPRGGMGGEGVVIWDDADEATRRRTLADIEREPLAWVAQERVNLSVHPTVIDGRLEPRHVDLRPYAVIDDSGVHLLPGGLSRVALEAGSMIVNSGRGGGVKDTWAE